MQEKVALSQTSRTGFARLGKDDQGAIDEGPQPARTSIGLDELAGILDRVWQNIVEFPRPLVCKHHAAGIVIQAMEELGIEPPVDIIRAVVFAHDDVSLAWKRDATTPPPENAT